MTFQVVAVLLLATVIRSVFGFGEALVAVPLLALIIPVEVAAPLAALVSITVAAVVLVRDWSQIHQESAGWLVLSTLPGLPLGLLLLTQVSEPIVKALLGFVIITFSLYSLLNRKRFHLRNDRHAWTFGFIAGILGGAYGMNGPPLVIYGTLRQWSPRQFRATLQGYFLPASILVMIGYWLAGLWTIEVNRYFLIALLPVLAAIFAGHLIHTRIPARRFLFYIHIGLTIIGAVLLIQSLNSVSF